MADTDDARDVLRQLGSTPTHRGGDIYQARPHPNVPEKDKPTAAQQRARQQNIKKTRRAAHRSRSH